MAAITAAMVKELREMTDAGMMECKKALVEAEGEIEKAVRKRAECDSIDFHGVESRLERRIDAAKRVVERSAARDLVELLSVERVER